MSDAEMAQPHCYISFGGAPTSVIKGLVLCKIISSVLFQLHISENQRLIAKIKPYDRNKNRLR